MIDSMSVSVEIFSRNADDSWHLVEFKQTSDHFTINSINLRIELSELYDGIS